MNRGASRSTNMRLAAVDGEVVKLPTLAGLLEGKNAVEAGRSGELWNTLAAAVLSDRAFDELERELDGELDHNGGLARVIHLDHWRSIQR